MPSARFAPSLDAIEAPILTSAESDDLADLPAVVRSDRNAPSSNDPPFSIKDGGFIARGLRRRRLDEIPRHSHRRQGMDSIAICACERETTHRDPFAGGTLQPRLRLLHRSDQLPAERSVPSRSPRANKRCPMASATTAPELKEYEAEVLSSESLMEKLETGVTHAGARGSLQIIIRP